MSLLVKSAEIHSLHILIWTVINLVYLLVLSYKKFKLRHASVNSCMYIFSTLVNITYALVTACNNPNFTLTSGILSYICAWMHTASILFTQIGWNWEHQPRDEWSRAERSYPTVYTTYTEFCYPLHRIKWHNIKLNIIHSE